MRKKLYTLGFCLSNLLVALPGAGQGFSAVETPWSLPVGGSTVATTNLDLSFYLTTGTALPSYYADGSQEWTMLDLNGDSKPELVVTAERTAGQTVAFGAAPNRYWKVYLGTSTGFANTAINWTLPVGGYALNGTDYGFYGLTHTSSTAAGASSQNWSTFDINGDGKADLVVTGESNQQDVVPFGIAPNRYWKVYLGTNTGFATTAINWTLPVGGAVKNNDLGFFLSAYSDATYGNGTSQNWSTFDISGDGKPDLVVTSQRAPNLPYYTLPFGTAPNRYWKVYLGTSTGFATTAINWPLPVGGALISGVDFGFFFSARNAVNDTGSQNWSTFDVSGDGKADLVVTSQVTGSNSLTFGAVPNRYWKVYLGTGSGFAPTATNWPLPAGGYIYNGVDCGFLRAEYPTVSFNDASGTQYWSTFDVSGDGKADLVVTSQKTGNSPLSFGTAPTRYWNVYLGTGTGFAPTATPWSLPAGGANSLSTDYGFWQLTYNNIYSPYNSLNNNHNWTTLDINGDGQSDLLVTSLFANTIPLPFGPPTDRYWKVYLGKAAALAATPASAADEVVLYPNPASDQLQVTSAKPLLKTSYLILDALGRTVQQGQLPSTSTINLRQLPPGLYGVRMGQAAASSRLLHFIKR